jgi:hypothetical protein
VKVTLLSPNGGEMIPSGSTYVVSWEAPSEVTRFRLFYSLDNGTTWKRITTQTPLTGLSYPWQVPKTGGNKSACRIKVAGYDGSRVVGSDVSEAPFSIEVVKLLSPNGGELYHPWDTATIEWRAFPEAHHFNLMLSIDHGLTWKLIQEGKGITATQLTTTLLPPNTGNKTKCLIKVVAYRPSGARVGADRSDGPFTVEVVKLTEPNGGGLPLRSGDPLTITWDTYATAEPITNVLLSYTLHGGTTWKSITTLPGGSSSHPWSVPKVTKAKTKCKVKVVLKDARGVTRGSDTSDSYFTVAP